jgi:hypothetical protein
VKLHNLNFYSDFDLLSHGKDELFNSVQMRNAPGEKTLT